MKYNNFLKFALILAFLAFGEISFASFATEAQAQYNKGIDFYKAGQLEASLNCFKEAIKLNPNYIDAYYNLGSIQEYLNNNEEALNAFKQIILRKPDDYESVYKAAEISHRLGQDDKAQMYLTLIPTDTIIGQKAHQLSQEILSSKSNTEEIQKSVKKPEEIQAEPVEEVKTEPAPVVNDNIIENSNFVYENISSPTGIATDSRGNLYVADFADNLIYKIGKDGKKLVFIKNTKIDGPIGLSIDAEDNIYIANYNKDNVIKVDINGTISTFIANISKPYCMYIKDNLLFVSSQGNNSVVRQKLSD